MGKSRWLRWTVKDLENTSVGREGTRRSREEEYDGPLRSSTVFVHVFPSTAKEPLDNPVNKNYTSGEQIRCQ